MQSLSSRRLPGVSLIAALCLSAYAPQASAQLALQLDYNEPNGAPTTREQVGGGQFAIRVDRNPAERVPGIEGNAFRTDGFSTWATGSFATPASSQMTIQTWVILESYPSDKEQPYSALTPSSIMHQQSGGNGFNIGINTYGEWWFTANINGQNFTVKSTKRFPLYEWVQVAAVVDSANGQLRLYLTDKTGTHESSTPIPAGGKFNPAAGAPLVIGKSNLDLQDGVFTNLNGMNAAYDLTKIYTVARDKNTLSSEYASMVGAASSPEEALQVTPLRFADDVLRPRFHGMPPANWTNEPHGLVFHNGKYHMFYQRTPNGPFKWQMHWGHMVSSDLVNWSHMKDALWPELNGNGLTGQGSKGIWSGDVVSVDGTAYAFFTTVNFGGPFDPGIARASSSDANLETWTKHTSGLIDKNAEGLVADFRDPYIWKDGATWHMIIGAKTHGGHGGLDHYTTQDIAGGWSRASAPFSSVPFSAMDIGSEIWEMPVFQKLGTINGQDKYILVVSPIGKTVSKLTAPYTRSVYWIGTWNGSQFTPDYEKPKNLDLIHGHLSPSIARRPDGKLAAIGIVDERSSSRMQNNLGWAHTFSVPREWALLQDGKTLGQAPLAALQTLRVPDSQQTISNVDVSGERKLAASGNQIEIIANVDPTVTGSQYGLMIGASPDQSEVTRIYYENGSIVIDKSRSSKNFENEELTLLRGSYDEAVFGKPRKFHIFFDHSVIDVFINDKAAFSNRIYPTSTDATGASASTGVLLYSAGGTTRFTSVDVWKMKESIGDVEPPPPPVPVELLDLPASVSVGQGSQVTVSAVLTPDNATNKDVKWESLNPGIATVDNGTIIGVAQGTATIKATSLDNASASDTMTVTVTPQATVPVELVDLPASVSVGQGGQVTVNAVVTPDNASNKNVKWESLNPAIATVNNGTVIGIAPGTATIKATSVDNASASDTMTVTVTPQTPGLVYDFDSLAGWTATGNAFSAGDIATETSYWGGSFNQHGARHLWSFKEGGDAQTGELRSEVFKLAGDGQIRFLISGGNNINELHLVLVRASDGVELPFKATGNNSEAYVERSFDARAHIGQELYLKLVDRATGGFGHINLDHVRIPGEKVAPKTLTYNFDSLAGWTATGNAFSTGDIATDTTYWGGPFNQHGTHHLWSFKDGGDAQTGELRSDAFTLGGDGQIRFLISGGDNLNELYLVLVRASDGVELPFKATGNNSEAYVERSFDARAHIGQRLYLKLVDRSTGGFGHVNLDHVRVPVQ